MGVWYRLCIIGGVGSNWGLVGGALLLATTQHLTAYYIGSQWVDAVAYIILILFLIARPLGFSGKRLKKNRDLEIGVLV